MKQYKGINVVGAKPMSLGPYNNLRGWTMPKGVFEKSYVAASASLDFSSALLLLKSGKKLARTGWNGKKMFIFLVDGSTFKVNRAPLLGIYKEGTKIEYKPHIDMKTADGTIVPWLASQSDLMATDWVIVR